MFTAMSQDDGLTTLRSTSGVTVFGRNIMDNAWDQSCDVEVKVTPEGVIVDFFDAVGGEVESTVCYTWDELMELDPARP